MKKSIVKGVVVFIIFFVLTVWSYDIVVRYLTNIYTKKLCVEEFCIEKPKDWIPLVVKRKGESYMYDTIYKENMEVSNFYFDDIENGILLRKGDAEIVLQEGKRKDSVNYDNSKLLAKKIINDKTYYIMNRNKSFIVVIFPELNLVFSISDTLNPQELVEHFIKTSTNNIKHDVQ